MSSISRNRGRGLARVLGARLRIPSTRRGNLGAEPLSVTLLTFLWLRCNLWEDTPLSCGRSCRCCLKEKHIRARPEQAAKYIAIWTTLTTLVLLALTFESSKLELSDSNRLGTLFRCPTHHTCVHHCCRQCFLYKASLAFWVVYTPSYKPLVQDSQLDRKIWIKVNRASEKNRSHPSWCHCAVWRGISSL